MKKILISLIISIITFGIIFLSINSKENKKEENKNISIILETEEGNLESDTFPNKNEYEYSSLVCENTSDEGKATFNEEQWKLNLSVEEKVIDGNFNCTIHFKEKTYEVKVEVENGIITGDTTKSVNYNESITFTINPTIGYYNPTVSCTNNQSGNINGNTLTISNVTNNTTCTVIYIEYERLTNLIKSQNTIKSSPVTTPGKDAATTNEGLIKGDVDDYGSNMYYFRGDIKNNYLEFADMMWRIVKINGDGSVKLILNDFITDSSGEALLIKYSNTGTASSISSAQNLLKFSNSILLGELNDFYEENLRKYDEVIETSKFCTDLSYYSYNGRTDFYTFYRLRYLSLPNSKCSSTSYIYNNKIGALTSDEIVYAGAAGYQTVSYIYNQSFYLYDKDYKANYFHTISPSIYYSNSGNSISNLIFDITVGNLVGSNLTNNIGIKPVISVDGSVHAKGTGTESDPYELVF